MDDYNVSSTTTNNTNASGSQQYEVEDTQTPQPTPSGQYTAIVPVDLSKYATKDDLKNIAKKLVEIEKTKKWYYRTQTLLNIILVFVIIFVPFLFVEGALEILQEYITEEFAKSRFNTKFIDTLYGGTATAWAAFCATVSVILTLNAKKND